MRVPRVYVVQRPSFRDRATNEWRDKYDLSAAAQYGELVYLVGSRGNVPQSTASVVGLLHEKLSAFTPEDYLVAIGDPVAIAAAACVASARTGGRLKILKWDRRIEGYLPYTLELVKANKG